MVYSEGKEPIEIPEIIPLLPVRDIVIFNHMFLPLYVGRESSINAVDEALDKDRLILLVTQKDPNNDSPKPDDIYVIGTAAMIMKKFKLPDGRVKILIQGLVKSRIKEYVSQEPYFQVRIEQIPDPVIKEISSEFEALMRNVKEQCEKILSLKGLISTEVIEILDSVNEPGRLADLVASNLRLKISESQQILETINPFERLEKVNEHLSKELEVSTMQAKIQSQAKEEMTKSQREYFLREQLKAIKAELGDIDEKTAEISEFSQKIKAAKMPPDVEKEARKQLERLEQMHTDAAEASIVRTYLDWLVEIPWSKSTKDNLDIKKAKKVLDEDHYNLEKVKERILEYLAVRKLKKKMKGPILCFVGPPGVGKTSLGKSIARALGRKFNRISLGGIRDEAEIRGHRRTYIGALPGRIIQGIKQAGSNNPIFMMDEIDKVGADFRGDPSAALLEVLDPEQNFSFSDHYLNLPFNLSNVMFITTANLVDPILSALKDRMEIINISGYTDEEKMMIAKKFLIPRQLEENGITKENVKITDKAILMTISHYTQESGLRNLEREIASIFRKVARSIAENKHKSHRVTIDNLHRYLGVPKYLPEGEQEISQIGVATGLAWTQSGGEVLYVEASTMKGKGNLTLTGHLGDVMKESAQAALTYARSKAKELHISPDFYEKLDLHIHVPAGAIPKDGPSAGVTMATAVISALTKTPVKKGVAMTGEITLRGRILPVGGLKEKSLGAIRAKIKTIIVPERNKKDLEEIPQNIKKQLNFVFVRTMDDVLQNTLSNSKRKKTTKKKR
ncbi:MAG: endopeptidase La [Deltaproteobacteria bacterium]|jgi:ATP-dependent Lon protease|nr:endopeptidase La [Deltaproteobacteria bacterium]